MLEEKDADGANARSYWIACHNFYVLTRYNRSRLYATAVCELAKAIRARARAADVAGRGSASADASARACATSPRVDASVAVGQRRRRPASAATIGAASVLPSSTPNWSNGLMPKSTASTNVRCS